jgi:hypothetical protein
MMPDMTRALVMRERHAHRVERDRDRDREDKESRESRERYGINIPAMPALLK